MIGVFGGTFDPVHFGHLRSALEVHRQLGLQETRWVPCLLPAHRHIPVASVGQRLAMLRLAIADQAGFMLDERELQREGPSYMVDTLQSLRNEFSRVPLCLILGMDAFQGLPGWRHWTRLPEYAHMVVMTRPGWSVPRDGELGNMVRERQVADHGRLRDQLAGRIFFYEVTRLEISASEIRRRLANGQSPRYLLPAPVLEFIIREKIYQS